MNEYRVLDLFSGIGGFSLGLERAGMRTVAFCEIDAFCRRVLRKHWPTVPIYDDIRELTAERLSADGIVPNVICGGFPCQDISDAGFHIGISGERSGLWKHYARIIGEVRPDFAIVENVAALLGRGIGVVLGDLATLGYDAEWHGIPAGRLGAPHERDRTWIVAYPMCAGLEGLRITRRIQAAFPIDGESLAFTNAARISRLHSLGQRRLPTKPDGSTDRIAWCGNEWPQTEPVICRMGDGIPDRVGRTSACGNAVIPQIPEHIGRAIIKAQENMT